MRICCSIFILLLVSCSEATPDVEEDKDQINSTDTIQESREDLSLFPNFLTPLDTILPDGRKILMTFPLENSVLELSISTKSWDTTYLINQSLENHTLNPMKDLKINWSSTTFIGIRESCGSPCDYEVLIPTVPNEKPSSYFFPSVQNDEGVSINDNLICYLGYYDGPSGNPSVKIKNMETGKIDSLSCTSKWIPKVSRNEWIDTLSATNSRIYIGQKDENGKIIASASKRISLD